MHKDVYNHEDAPYDAHDEFDCENSDHEMELCFNPSTGGPYGPIDCDICGGGFHMYWYEWVQEFEMVYFLEEDIFGV